MATDGPSIVEFVYRKGELVSLLGLITEHGQDVQFQRLVETSDATGEHLRTWINLGSVLRGWFRAAPSGTLAPASRLETKFQSQNIGVHMVLYTISDPGVTYADRVVIAGNKYVIIGVTDQAGLGRLFKFEIQLVK